MRMACGLLLIACGCNGPSPSPAPRPSASGSTKASQPLPSRSSAVSQMARYLAYSVEGHHESLETWSALYSQAKTCDEELYGDGWSSYWLAEGRVLGWTARFDTLTALLELHSVAIQEPSTEKWDESLVTSRIAFDTVSLKMVPDSSRLQWVVCGVLSNQFRLGGHDVPTKTFYSPGGVNRRTLLAQVDSIRRSKR